MYAGRIVEIADNRSLFHQPRHPYTAALVRAVPVPDPAFKGDLSILQGEVADASDLPTGCAFHPRCPFAQDICCAEMPQLRSLGSTQRAACHFADQIQLEITAKKN